ncbi:MAG: DoxX family protein [Ignavibacteriales bacterium]|nr:DoxX family protein [Ignavibacteriales bacterium]
MSKETTEKILRIFLGAMFLFSGISKLFPIEAFEVVTWQQGLVSLELAPYFSRLMISFEILLGVLFLVGYKMRKFTLPASLFLLAVFTIYLFVIELSGKGRENCGCFGELIPMTGIESILKNIVFMGMTVYLFYLTVVEKKSSYLYIAAGYVTIFAVMMFFFSIKPYEAIQPVPTLTQGEVSEEQIEQEPVTINDTAIAKTAIKDSIVTKKDTEVKKEKPKLSDKYPNVVSVYSNLVPGADVGLSVITFFSLDCEHCLQVATELNGVKSLLVKVKRHYLFLGAEEEITPFFSKSGGSVGYTLLNPQKFYPHLSSAPPKVILLANGNAVLQMEGNAVSVSQLTTRIKELTDNYSY